MLFPDPADPFALSRFIQVQQRDYVLALSELRAGQKRSHWIWYVFPQFAGLGRSPTSARFAIRSLEEARAYLAHPVLGERLTTCAETVFNHDGLTVPEIFGHPDDLKFRSSMTLFAVVAGPGSVFQHVLEKYFAGHGDSATLELLRQAGEQQ